jgi:phosphatidylethanolamine/phosphatidyl-N-methylethanolamine N-methyltransferase
MRFEQVRHQGVMSIMSSVGLRYAGKNLSSITDQRPSADLSVSTVSNAYGRWAGVYDAFCAPIFQPAHRAAAAAANDIGGNILEVGVGTGLLLPLYGRHLWVTGLDISYAMLARARLRLRRQTLPHVAALEAGDIHALRHPDRHYDAIVMPFVLTLLAAPEAALTNCLRMLKPGGEIIIVSHFQSESPTIARIERWLAPRISSLGLRPDFPITRVRVWAAGWSDVDPPIERRVGPLGVYRLVRLRKSLSTGRGI